MNLTQYLFGIINMTAQKLMVIRNMKFDQRDT